MLKKFRKVEFRGEIGVILQQSRDLQYTVQFTIKVLTATRAHAQYIIMVKGGGCKKVMRN